MLKKITDRMARWVLVMCLLSMANVFAAEIPLIISKEYQIVLKNDAWVSFVTGQQALLQLLQDMEDNPALDFKYKSGSGEYSERAGVRYDTPQGWLSASHLNLKIESSQKDSEPRGKLKLKYNCSDSDACVDFRHPERAFSYPAEKYADDARFKLELDMHQTYGKYGLGGWVKRKKHIELTTLADAENYFPGLKRVPGFVAATPLQPIKTYYERVFDEIKVKFAGYRGEAALVVRYPDAASAMPERVELSFKLKQDKDGWEQEALIALGAVYGYLLASDWNAEKDQPEPGEFLIPVAAD